MMFLLNLSDFTAADLSRAVHHGVYSSIASVVLAISLIVFVFRGAINWIESNKSIKWLAHVWMVLNSMLLITIAFKNWKYISSFGLTEKRIGVFIYLILCVIGITTVFIKVHKALNFTFLIRKNLSWGIAALAILGWVNWSAIISSYNIDNEHSTLSDLYYYYPQNTLVLKEAGYYQKVIALDNYKYENKKDLGRSDNRNWQEFNYTFYKAATYEK